MARAKAPRMNFTKASIAALVAPAPGAGRSYVYDIGTPGLLVCVTSGGCKTFYRGGRVHGRPVRIKIGRFPGTTVEQARREARRLAGHVAEGANPQAQRQAARREQTFGELFADFMETWSRPRKRTWREDQRIHDRYLKPLDARKVSEIGKVDIMRLHSRVTQRHGAVTANRALALITAVYNQCADEDVRNPTRKVKPNPEESRKRILEPDELPRWHAAVKAEPPDWRDFWRLLLMVGCRHGNLRSARWEEMDLDEGLWTIPAGKSKNKRETTLVLVPEAVAILRHRKSLQETGFLFPARSRTGYIVEIMHSFKRILKRAGIEGLTPHDLRRTYGVSMIDAGASLPIAAEGLGHASTSATRRYTTPSRNPVREAVERGVAAMLNAGTPRLVRPSAEAS